MTKEERIMRYIDLATTYEGMRHDTSYLMKELGISHEDIQALQIKKESEISMSPVEKRNIVVKQVIKPLLKKYRFSTAGSDWHREIEDSYIIIHMMNSQFNNNSGVGFRFHISASKKDEIRGKLSSQWIHNQRWELRHFDFLPYCGELSPFMEGDMFTIGGYKNYMPVDTPIEDICREIEEEFDKYVLPELQAVKSYEDFVELREQKRKRYQEKEMRILHYYGIAMVSASELSGIAAAELLPGLRKKLELSKEDILSHFDWLDIRRRNSSFPNLDAKDLIIKTLNDEI